MTETVELTVIQREMIEEFQCPGCVCGYRTSDCKAFKPEVDEGMARCLGHVTGTSISGIGRIALGLPKGFCRTGFQENGKPFIRLWEGPKSAEWDRCNIAVWAMESDGYLFVRTFMPRLNMSVVDVIKDGKREDLCPQAIDVGEFIDEID